MIKVWDRFNENEVSLKKEKETNLNNIMITTICLKVLKKDVWKVSLV